MLNREVFSFQQTEAIYVMTDVALIAATVKASLHEVAKQAEGLATGLQNAAPGSAALTPNKSVQYLFSTAEQLAKLAEDCDKLR
jgi:hypothetical protein